MSRRAAVSTCLATLLLLSACSEQPPDALIVGSWVIDMEAQREEFARVSPSQRDDFDDVFRMNLEPIRETFYRDGRYDVVNTLGGPFDDRWEVVSKGDRTVTIRSSGHTWIARGVDIAAGRRERSPSELTYTFDDADHMYVTTTVPVYGEEKKISFFFVRDD